jgi:oxygen-independent coproporphyrinogen-3 oxidase
MTRTANSPETLDLARVLAVLGPAAAVSYAPPNIYPMSAPRFTAGSGAERPHPVGRDLGIYVHIPFCSYHCTFCFYATKIGADLAQKRRYVNALITELDWVREGSLLTQLYVGGGTPTALPPGLLARMLEAVFQKMASGRRHAHTVEASPETLTPEHVAVLQSHGIGRVSMGVQSLNDGVLDTVQRRHTREMVEASCRLLVEAGLMVNIDLIYGLPGQTHDGFRRDFEAIAGLGAQSITTYNLRVNERTPVARSLADDERLDLANLVRWRSTVTTAARALGFVPKRWHTFHRHSVDGPAAEVVRNFEDVTGHGNQFSVGMSARSRLDNVVFRNHASFETYLERVENGRSPVEETIALSGHERKLRFLALTLGDGKALPRAAYQEEFGCLLESDFSEPLTRLSEAGLIQEQLGSISLTETGQLLYDLVTRAFYPETVRRWMEERQSLAAVSANLRPRPQRTEHYRP